jgi:poly-gamma-glutamate capsule biosynthesis protein CapA/YwtB (metallophosphatase superfamily)
MAELSRRDFLGLASFSLCSGPDRNPARPGQDVTLCLFGDVMTGRGIDQVLPHPSQPRIYESYMDDARGYVRLAEKANGPIPAPVDFSYVWGAALQEMHERRADLRIINLETSVTTSEQAFPKGINYRMHPRNVGCLSAFGLDCCVLANNHVLDFGEAGLLETLDTLHRSGLRTAGAGRTLEQARAPAVMRIDAETRVLVYAFGTGSSGVPPSWAAQAGRPGVALLSELSARSVGEIARGIARERRPSDLVVVSIHWGGNWGYQIPAEQRQFAHALIEDASVDVVHGYSSHHAKGIEVHRGRPILYGCGDFLNDYEGISGHESYRDDLPVMYVAQMTSAHELARLELVPFQIKKFSLQRAGVNDRAWLQVVLSREGAKLGTRVEQSREGSLELFWG